MGQNMEIWERPQHFGVEPVLLELNCALLMGSVHENWSQT